MNSNAKKASPTVVLKRVLRYMLHNYKFHFLAVVLCILISAIANVSGATFPQTLVDDYIVPMINTGSTDFSGLWSAVCQLICLLAVGRGGLLCLQPHHGHRQPGHHAPPA